MGDCMYQMIGAPMIGMMVGGGFVLLLLIAALGLSVAALIKYLRGAA